MSTEIAEIIGIPELSRRNRAGKIFISRFNSSLRQESIIQLNMTTKIGERIQLNIEQVKELIQVLNDCFDYDKYPSE